MSVAAALAWIVVGDIAAQPAPPVAVAAPAPVAAEVPLQLDLF